MGKWLRENQLKFLWGLVAIIGFLALINTESVGTLRTALDEQAGTIAQPLVQAQIVPGVPADLVDELEAASEEVGDPARNGHLWLSLALSNRGFAEAERVAADIDMAPAIAKRFALAYDGDNTGERWGGPQIAEPEEGTSDDASAITVQFDTLPVNETHWVFLGFQPDGFGAPPYSAAERRRWAGEYRHALDRMAVTSLGGEGEGATRMSVTYGLDATSETPQADTTPEAGVDRVPG